MSEARDSRVIEENRRQIERLSKLGWYHSIELPGGGVIEGHQSLAQLKKRVAQFPIPQDLTGKRVLDIGAWDGWFSFEMERRGASVLSVDSTRNTRLLEAKKLLGSKIEYHIADICRLTAKEVGTFDIVLFLGVLYHLKHPVMALENVCGMCREMACIESFVTEGDLHTIPVMEFYETTELRGQLDNWVGPNLACLMAFCRTAGFARVEFESVLGERAHVTGYRQWASCCGAGAAPKLLCVDNAATHDHNFSANADDYLTVYFTASGAELNCDNVYPQIGAFGSRPIYVARTGGGWQATSRIPPGLQPGWYDVALRVGESAASAPVQIGVDTSDWRPTRTADFEIARVADGKTFEPERVRVGDDSAVTVWAKGLRSFDDARVRLNGTDLPAIWSDAATGQINALLPAGLLPGPALVTLVVGGRETVGVKIELFRE